MSDNFIPLNQSTPVKERNYDRSQQRGYQNSWNQRYQNRRSNNSYNRSNRWGNNSQCSYSFESDYNNSPAQDNRNNIDAYLHPSMLQDPWAQLRQIKK